MPIVELTLPEGGNAPAWYLLELQGTLSLAASVASASGSSSLDGHVLGDIAPRAGARGGVVLHVGASRVNGTVEKLPKPLLVLERDDEESGAGKGAGAGAGIDAGENAGAGAGAVSGGAVSGRRRARFEMEEGDAGADGDEGGLGGAGGDSAPRTPRTPTPRTPGPTPASAPSPEPAPAPAARKRYKVVAIVRMKVVFTERPQPVIGLLQEQRVAAAAAAAASRAAAIAAAAALRDAEAGAAGEAE